MRIHFFTAPFLLCDAVLANACFLELELKTDFEVAEERRIG